MRWKEPLEIGRPVPLRIWVKTMTRGELGASIQAGQDRIVKRWGVPPPGTLLWPPGTFLLLGFRGH